MKVRNANLLNLHYIDRFQSSAYEKLLQEYNDLKIENEEDVASYYEIRQRLDKLVIDFRKYLTNIDTLLPFLQPGRLVKVC